MIFFFCSVHLLPTHPVTNLACVCVCGSMHHSHSKQQAAAHVRQIIIIRDYYILCWCTANLPASHIRLDGRHHASAYDDVSAHEGRESDRPTSPPLTTTTATSLTPTLRLKRTCVRECVLAAEMPLSMGENMGARVCVCVWRALVRPTNRL